MKIGKLHIIIAATVIGCMLVIFLGINLRQSQKYSNTEYNFMPRTNYLLNDNGLYYISDGIAMYYDISSKKQVTLGQNTTDSYYQGTLGMLMYNDKLYCITSDRDQVSRGYVKETLYQCDYDGNNRKKFFDFPEGGAGIMYAYEGKIYYTFNYYSDKEEEFNKGYNTVSLNVLDLRTKKNKVLYEIQNYGPEHDGLLEICRTDDRQNIYCSFLCYEGEVPETYDSDDLNHYSNSKLLCYNIKTGKMQDCFPQVPKGSYIKNASVIGDYLYCTIQDFGKDNGLMKLERFSKDGQESEVIIKSNEEVDFNSWNHYICVENGNQDLLYNIEENKCMEQVKDVPNRIVAISKSGEYIALDGGDYSDLKEGDTFMRSRFVPEILDMETYLKNFKEAKEGTIGKLEYSAVNNY